MSNIFDLTVGSTFHEAIDMTRTKPYICVQKYFKFPVGAQSGSG